MERAWEQTKKEEEERAPTLGCDRDFDIFVNAYKEAALFSTNDESDESGGVPLDANFSIDDFTEETATLIRKECWLFFLENREDCMCQDDASQAGYDFWMTRNGHGVGFWECPDWPKDEGRRLTEASKKVGECWLYVTDDGKVAQM